jgi:formate dehydrogenase subunit delta
MEMTTMSHMANRIGEFFESMPEREAASNEITLYLRKSWEPRMRRELLAHLERTGGAGLLPIVRDAVRAHRQQLA